VRVTNNGIEFGGAKPAYVETGLIDRPLILSLSPEDPKRFASLARTIVRQSVATGLQLCICVEMGTGQAMIYDRTLVQPYGCIAIMSFDAAKAKIAGVFNGLTVHFPLSRPLKEALYHEAKAEWDAIQP